jgi:lysozyme
VGKFELLKKHEGLRLKTYECTAGALTIGYGRNLDANGIRESEAEIMLYNDVSACELELTTKIQGWFDLSEVRQAVLVNMVFNLGWPRLSRFKRMIAAVEAGKYQVASIEMLDSRWAEQVGNRASELSLMMESNRWTKC